jgi:hypothetical protein
MSTWMMKSNSELLSSGFAKASPGILRSFATMEAKLACQAVAREASEGWCPWPAAV